MQLEALTTIAHFQQKNGTHLDSPRLYHSVENMMNHKFNQALLFHLRQHLIGNTYIQLMQVGGWQRNSSVTCSLISPAIIEAF